MNERYIARPLIEDSIKKESGFYRNNFRSEQSWARRRAIKRKAYHDWRDTQQILGKSDHETTWDAWEASKKTQKETKKHV